MARVLWLLLLGCGGVLGGPRGITSGDELVASVIGTCFDGEDSVTRCLKLHTLGYLDHLTGSPVEEEGRSSDDRLDDLVLNRVRRFLTHNNFKVQLPEFFFQEATLTFKPSEGLGEFDVSFPAPAHGEERAYTEARDMMKQKLLLPILLLLKLKLKALTPILVALVGMKALKALVLSKISILLVVGFLAAQLFKKAGMMPMMPMMTMEPAPATSMAYGPPAPAAPAPPVTMSSYEPSWEPSQGGPYQRNWEPQQAVYTAYLEPQPQTPALQVNPPATP